MMSCSSVSKIGFGFGLLYCSMVLPVAAQGYSQEQQQLCTGDAFRLCGPAIPDIDRVTACMIRQRAQLSPGCQSVFRPDPVTQPVPMRASRPVSLKPKTAKSRRPKKSQR